MNINPEKVLKDYLSRCNTLPQPADRIVTEFVRQVCSINPEFINGIYLTGSISLNDFYSNKSDIDFLVLCKKFPDKNIAEQIKKFHRSICRRHRKPDLSGCYLASESILSEDPERIKALSWHEGVLKNDTFEMAPITLSELKSNGITVYGTEASALPLTVRSADLKNFLYRNINSYWTKWITGHKVLLFIFPRFTEWSVLGVARQLCTLQTDKIVSKTEAGYYCLQHLPEKFHPVIREAIEIRKDNKTYPFVKSYFIKPSFSRMKQTILCVNYIIDLFNQTYKEQHL